MHLRYHVLLVECAMLGRGLPLKQVKCKLLLQGLHRQVLAIQLPYLIRKWRDRPIIILNFKKELYLILKYLKIYFLPFCTCERSEICYFNHLCPHPHQSNSFSLNEETQRAVPDASCQKLLCFKWCDSTIY